MRSGYNTRSGYGAGREERCGLWVITELGLSSTRISSLETRVTNNENGIATNAVTLDSSGSAVCPSGMSATSDFTCMLLEQAAALSLGGMSCGKCRRTSRARATKKTTRRRRSWICKETKNGGLSKQTGVHKNRTRHAP